MQLMPDSPIRQVALEIENDASGTGWDQAPRLFALVSTAELIEQEPGLVDQLGIEGELAPGALSSIEQEDLPAGETVEAILGQIGWPEQVKGCAAVLERVMLPPSAEEQLPQDRASLESFVAAHPDRQEVRIVAAVDRQGNCHSTVRSRDSDDADLLEGPDLVPTLIELLKQTLAD